MYTDYSSSLVHLASPLRFNRASTPFSSLVPFSSSTMVDWPIPIDAVDPPRLVTSPFHHTGHIFV
jgi:hypothetical protein